MSETKNYSVFIRLICGVLGVLGIAALIFNFQNTGKIEISLLSLASAFALFFFFVCSDQGHQSN
jgi:hypothetical protein